MHVGIEYGSETVELDVAPERLLVVHRQPEVPTLTDPEAAIAEALEKPHGFPALRRALTPDDHVTIVVDERLPHLARLIVPVLEHLYQAQVRAEAVTILCAPSTRPQ